MLDIFCAESLSKVSDCKDEFAQLLKIRLRDIKISILLITIGQSWIS